MACRSSDIVVLTGPPDSGMTAVLQQLAAIRVSQARATIYINCREGHFVTSGAFAAKSKSEIVAQLESEPWQHFAHTVLETLPGFRHFVAAQRFGSSDRQLYILAISDQTLPAPFLQSCNCFFGRRHEGVY